MYLSYKQQYIFLSEVKFGKKNKFAEWNSSFVLSKLIPFMYVFQMWIKKIL